LEFLVVTRGLEQQTAAHAAIQYVIDVPARHLSSPSCHGGDDGKSDAGLAGSINRLPK
jgi:hypothetical protein